jgi:hypothetical protein
MYRRCHDLLSHPGLPLQQYRAVQGGHFIDHFHDLFQAEILSDDITIEAFEPALQITDIIGHQFLELIQLVISQCIGEGDRNRLIDGGKQLQVLFRKPVVSFGVEDQVPEFCPLDGQMHHHDGIVHLPGPLNDGSRHRIHEHTVPHQDRRQIGVIQKLPSFIVQRHDDIDPPGFCGGGHGDGPQSAQSKIIQIHVQPVSRHKGAQVNQTLLERDLKVELSADTQGYLSEKGILVNRHGSLQKLCNATEFTATYFVIPGLT